MRYPDWDDRCPDDSCEDCNPPPDFGCGDPDCFCFDD